MTRPTLGSTSAIKAEQARLLAQMAVRGRGRPQARVDGRMNGLEAEYAKQLELRRLAGVIARWDFQVEKLRLADRTWYEPDFRVVGVDGTIEYHEVKGHWEDDARVKIKVAAELHPYGFVAVTEGPRPHPKVAPRWEYEVILPDPNRRGSP